MDSKKDQLPRELKFVYSFPELEIDECIGQIFYPSCISRDQLHYKGNVPVLKCFDCKENPVDESLTVIKAFSLFEESCIIVKLQDSVDSSVFQKCYVWIRQ
jgi:hypothetical protein